MTTAFLAALNDARRALAAVGTVEPGEAAVAKRFARELDETIARLEGKDPEKDLVAVVCHDLKDPLESSVMGAGFLKKTIPAEDGAARRVVEAIARSAERMNQVVSDFHDLAKLEAGQLEVVLMPCDVGGVLHAAVAAVEGQAKERDVGLSLEAPEGLIASCDRARLLQIVSKLIGNALKFTPAGGRVQIRAERDEAMVRVGVRDTGRGIPPERLKDVFDRAANARRTPRDGPGLGLAIARGLVELQSGAIGVESRVAEGSHFWFTLRAIASSGARAVEPGSP
jgi:signal transduction histidine kinase